MAGDDRTTGFQCAYRRFISDGFIANRFEIAIVNGRVRGGSDGQFSEKDVVRLSNDWLETLVRVPSWEGGDSNSKKVCELGQAGRPLARHLLESTTQSSNVAQLLDGLDSFTANLEWVLAGRPLLLFEFDSAEAAVPRTAKLLDLPEGVGFRLAHRRLSYRGGPVPTWMIEKVEKRLNREALRNIRLHLSRLHLEYECVRMLIRSAIVEGADRDEKEWKKFFNSSIAFLSNSKNYGFEQDPMLAAAYRAQEMVNQAERSIILDMLSEERAQEFERIEKVSGSGGPVPSSVVIGGNVYFWHEEHTMNGHTVNVGGDFDGFVGDRNVVQDSLNRINDSQASSELKGTLEALSRAVVLAANKMQESDAARLVKDWEIFRDEALQPEPRKGILQAMGETLQKAAQLVGDVGAPVANLVTAVMGLFP